MYWGTKCRKTPSIQFFSAFPRQYKIDDSIRQSKYGKCNRMIRHYFHESCLAMNEKNFCCKILYRTRTILFIHNSVYRKSIWSINYNIIYFTVNLQIVDRNMGRNLSFNFKF